ncbi:MAG TPA: Rpn family recombination-promoting nuclease/putative transposase [Candidatus Scybalocola faecigallinarum]|uniref:Rpn family recombination-promoting nuclease/putative transposase n=1 Tax=Candidatus Scybalocola faecigallinarum TaxID=2840941 RepID=A0A9D1JQ61_9FIRM|nr:Rpn family recombination-promoting nuclease/putative transposase [Candidatus Scybalocola faecigallinarum]
MSNEFQKLTIKDSFMFAAENGTQRHFNVEMQVERPKSLPRRTRYYHSQMDMDLLASGADYNLLPNTYVIFICDFAIFQTGPRLYRYTFRNRCDEDGRVLDDGHITVLLSTKGENDPEISSALRHFLKYVGNPENPSKDTANDSYVRSLSAQIAAIKRSRSWEAKYVLFKEIMNQQWEAGHREGRQEGLLEGRISTLQEVIFQSLGQYGTLPDSLVSKIKNEKDESVLTNWHLAALKSSSLEDFTNNM